VLRSIADRYKLRLYYLTGAGGNYRTGPRASEAADPDSLVREIQDVEPSGEQTRLGAAIHSVLDDLRGTAPAALVLLSDGVNTEGPDLVEGAAYARRKGVPLFVVALGDSQPKESNRLLKKEVDSEEIAEVARQFAELGFQLIATSGTAATLEKAGLKVERIHKLQEGRPNAIDLLKNKELQMVINTPSGATPRADEIKIRTTAVYTGTPIMTTISSAIAAVRGIAAIKESGYTVKTVQEYH